MSIGDILKNIFTSCKEPYDTAFKWSLEVVLEHEGGYVNHPRDTGGATNLGITKRTYEDWVGREVTIQEMRNLQIEDVLDIYYHRYWKRSHAHQMPNGINLSVFDFAVNAGPDQAIRSLQRVLDITIDGIVGPETASAIQRADQAKLIGQYAEERSRFYRSLSNYDVFGRGWERRTRETAAKSLELKRHGGRR